MGSKQSSAYYGLLKLRNLKDCYIAGETVSGVLQIDIEHIFPAHTLVIQVVGLEKTS